GVGGSGSVRALAAPRVQSGCRAVWSDGFPTWLFLCVAAPAPGRRFCRGVDAVCLVGNRAPCGRVDAETIWPACPPAGDGLSRGLPRGGAGDLRYDGLPVRDAGRTEEERMADSDPDPRICRGSGSIRGTTGAIDGTRLSQRGIQSLDMERTRRSAVPSSRWRH